MNTQCERAVDSICERNVGIGEAVNCELRIHYQAVYDRKRSTVAGCLHLYICPVELNRGRMPRFDAKCQDCGNHFCLSTIKVQGGVL